jgi:hypothetical protein
MWYLSLEWDAHAGVSTTLTTSSSSASSSGSFSIGERVKAKASPLAMLAKAAQPGGQEHGEPSTNQKLEILANVR